MRGYVVQRPHALELCRATTFRTKRLSSQQLRGWPYLQHSGMRCIWRGGRAHGIRVEPSGAHTPLSRARTPRPAISGGAHTHRYLGRAQAPLSRTRKRPAISGGAHTPRYLGRAHAPLSRTRMRHPPRTLPFMAFTTASLDAPRGSSSLPLSAYSLNVSVPLSDGPW